MLISVGSVTRPPSGRGGVVAGGGQPVQRRLQQGAVQLGDHEPAGIGAVAVVVQGAPGLHLGPVGLGVQLVRLVPVRQLDRDRLEHPPRRLPQPFRVQRPTRPGPDPGGLGHQRRLRSVELLAGHPGRGPLGRLHDHPDLLDPQPTRRERLPGRRIGLLQPPRQPQPTRGDLPGIRGQPHQPRRRVGVRGLLRHPPHISLRGQCQPPGRDLGLQRRQLRDRLSQLVCRERTRRDRQPLTHRPTSPRDARCGLSWGSKLGDRHVPNSTSTDVRLQRFSLLVDRRRRRHGPAPRHDHQSLEGTVGCGPDR